MAQNKLANGEKPSSVTVDHLFQYPLLSQSFDFYQQQPLGAKSLELANAIYQRFAPIFATPASYIAPYASKVDQLGDSSLQTVDNYVPQIKETDFGTIHSYATWPYSYVRDTYSDEYNKTTKRDGKNVIALGKAILSTEIRIASESLHYVADVLGPKRDEAKEKFDNLKGAAQQKAGEYKQFGQEKLSQGQEKAEQGKQTAAQKAEEGKKTAGQKKEQLANGSA